MSKKVPEKIQDLLKQIWDDIKLEDQSVRERQIREWKRLKMLWEGLSNVWYSEIAHDWRVWDLEAATTDDQGYYDKPINVLKAYLESIIAALSVVVPPLKCFPDDADNTLDLDTARAGDKIAQLIYRHNEVGLLWLHALFIYVTEGMVAFHTYSEFNEEYGTYKEDITEDVSGMMEQAVCSVCGYLISQKETYPGEAAQLKKQEIDEFDPNDEDAVLHDILIAEQKEVCPQCMTLVDVNVAQEPFITTRLVDSKTLPKSRVKLDAYGGLYVKIPNYAKCQKDVPYLALAKEINYTIALAKYKNLRGKNKELIESIKSRSEPGGYEYYEQWGRLSPQYRGEFPQNVVTETNVWIRPCHYNILDDEKDIDALTKLYPDGVKVTFINDFFATACAESLDDHWTLLEQPMSDYLHFNPMGQGLVSVQDITNDLISLILQTIEHGIGQTFADPGVLQFTAYENTEVTPGGIFPATPKSGKSLSEAFMELRTATLSPEVMPFGANIQQMGQLAVGAQPSIFGGNIEGSKTASEYSMARNQALQRLQNSWKLFTSTWKRVFSKAIPEYINNVKDDEREVVRNDDGNFINVFIRRAELEGKIGRIELEANENLPLTWNQKKDLLMTLLEAGNPKIAEILNAPQNAALIHEALGLVDFYVPGEDDIIKQYDEIKELLQSAPIQDPATGQEFPSVEIDPIYDNHMVEFDIVRKWAISEAGRQTKIDNEPGYRNVLLHGRLHYQEMIMQQMQQAQTLQQSGAAPAEKPDPKSKEAPITGEKDVQTVS